MNCPNCQKDIEDTLVEGELLNIDSVSWDDVDKEFNCPHCDSKLIIIGEDDWDGKDSYSYFYLEKVEE